VQVLIPYTQPAPYHSQWGEDRWLAEQYVLPPTGVFVDVGAGDGVRGSNTLYFENLGWSGLCVDADPRNQRPLRRRQCHVVTCAVSTTPGRSTFGLHAVKPSWSGLGLQGPDYRQIPVRCRTLQELLDHFRISIVDLLSIDVEGTELDVWDSFDHARPLPAVVIVEFDDARPERHRDTILDRVGRDRYDLAHETPANLILARTGLAWPQR
jgi:FkbM family methyltransferase